MRTPPPISIPIIADAVRAAHSIDAAVLTFVRGGEEAWQYNVAGASGAYRLKIYSDQRDIDKRAAASYYLAHVAGISNVVAPLPLKSGGFTFDVAGHRAALFTYILAAPSTAHPMTEAQSHELGRVLATIHATDLQGMILPVEPFGTQAADELEAVLDALPAAAAGSHPARRALAEVMLPVRDRIYEDVMLLRETAAEAQAANLPMVVCHGDPGPDNILIGDGVYLIDWDDMRFAPKEIDLMHFPADSPVMDGYREASGMAAPNDLALRYARVLWNNEDIAGFAGRALFQDLSAAQFEHNIATLRNILSHRGIVARR